MAKQLSTTDKAILNILALSIKPKTLLLLTEDLDNTAKAIELENEDSQSEIKLLVDIQKVLLTNLPLLKNAFPNDEAINEWLTRNKVYVPYDSDIQNTWREMKK